MTQLVENYCSRTELLLRLLDGDLSNSCSERVKDEIRRVLHFKEPEPAVWPFPMLAEADE